MPWRPVYDVTRHLDRVRVTVTVTMFNKLSQSVFLKVLLISFAQVRHNGTTFWTYQV